MKGRPTLSGYSVIYHLKNGGGGLSTPTPTVRDKIKSGNYGAPDVIIESYARGSTYNFGTVCWYHQDKVC